MDALGDIERPILAGEEGVEEIGVAGSKGVRRTSGIKRHKTAAQWNARRASRVAFECNSFISVSLSIRVTSISLTTCNYY